MYRIKVRTEWFRILWFVINKPNYDRYIYVYIAFWFVLNRPLKVFIIKYKHLPDIHSNISQYIFRADTKLYSCHFYHIVNKRLWLTKQSLTYLI